MTQATPAAAPSSGRSLELLPTARLLAVEAAVARVLEPGGDLDPRLAGAVTATLERPGSLWRAQLADAVGRAEGLSSAVALDLAAAVESFHTASLIFDDLPAMDDAQDRRGAPCVHTTFGEAAALLAALAFVHRGYALVWRALESVGPAGNRATRELVEECLGLTGILDGQARDLHVTPGPKRLAEAERLAGGKTIPLLRLALELPAAVAGADAARRGMLRERAEAWGLAYQIVDDLGDVVEDAAGAGATLAGRPNFAVTLGRRGAAERLDAELARARDLANQLAAERDGLDSTFARLADVFAVRRVQLLAPTPLAAG